MGCDGRGTTDQIRISLWHTGVEMTHHSFWSRRNGWLKISARFCKGVVTTQHLSVYELVRYATPCQKQHWKCWESDKIYNIAVGDEWMATDATGHIKWYSGQQLNYSEMRSILKEGVFGRALQAKIVNTGHLAALRIIENETSKREPSMAKISMPRSSKGKLLHSNAGLVQLWGHMSSQDVWSLYVQHSTFIEIRKNSHNLSFDTAMMLTYQQIAEVHSC